MNLTMISKKDIEQFQKKVLQFYLDHKRNLPWRQTTDPYKILVSEFMLQQTQVSRVIEYYTKWIKQWPTVQKLATEEYKKVLQAWMGLGYNRRARYLHNTATVIVNEFNGDVLTAVKHYEKLPGIGLYTSKAVQIFSANKDIATVDTNIRRIFINEFNLDESISDTDLFLLAKQCLTRGKSRDWHNALMDYGSMHLTSRKTGIRPKTQQSPFKGSDREIRGKILRLLLNEAQSSYDLEKQLYVNPDRLVRILNKMCEEKTISKVNKQYLVPKR